MSADPESVSCGSAHARACEISYGGPTRIWKARMTTFTAYIEFDEETQLSVGIVPGVPGAHTQAPSLDELRANLQEC